MKRSQIRYSSIWLTTIVVSLGCCFAVSQTSAQTTPKAPVKSAKPSATKHAAPQTFQLQSFVEQSLAKKPYYAPGILISRSDVEDIFSQLLERGVTTPDDQEDLAESVLADSSFLVGRLKTPAGRAFMKKIASDPTAYDRLERLSWTPHGRQLIDSLIKAPDGAARLQQLKSPEQLAKVSKRLAADASTADFALPTSRAHTAEELIAKLQEVVAAKNAAE